MKQKRWKKILAILLVAMIGLLPVQALGEDKSLAMATKGVNYIERMGIGFALDGQMALRDGDLLQSCVGSQLAVSSGGTTLAINENALVRVADAAVNGLSLELPEGELLANVAADAQMRIKIAGEQFVIRDAIVLFSARAGSATASVIYGSISSETDSALTAEAGRSLVLLENTTECLNFSAESLNTFALEQLLGMGDGQAMCFTKAELEKVIADRDAEKRLALEEQAAHDARVRQQGGTEKVTVSTSGSGAAEVTGPKCTIQIRCDTILDNLQDLTEGKNSYVPANGIILATSTIGFAEGETVFEVLKRACEYAHIQIEYSWTPMYNSYYIEGINHLYEFDCGEESGWMYKVNGWFPNYGCSSYTLKDGDTIVWCYTCKGLGADVGGSVY